MSSARALLLLRYYVDSDVLGVTLFCERVLANTPENGHVGSRRISANGNGGSIVGDIDSNGDGVLVVCSRDDGDGSCNDKSGATTTEAQRLYQG